MKTGFIHAVAMAGLLALLPLANAQECALRVTTWGGSYQKTYEQVVAQFEKEQHCKVQWVVGGSPDHLIKSRLGQVDVATNTLINSIAGEKEGLWQELDKKLVPNLANVYPNAVHSPYTIWVNAGDYVLVYNTDKVTETPKSWDVMWEPKYKNRVVLYDFDNIGSLALMVLQAQKHGGSIDNIDPGIKRMASLAKSGNLISVQSAESQMISRLQTGDAWLAMLAAGRVKELLQKGVKNIKVVRPAEGTFPVISTINVTKAAKDPKMAMTFVNYVLSPAWQQAFAVNNTYSPTVRNAAIPRDYEYSYLLVKNEEFQQLFLPDQTKVAERRGAWRNSLSKQMSD